MSIFRAMNISINVNDRELFKNLSFEVKPGEVFVVMGASGSGKSSLLNYIVGSLPQTLQASGQLFLDDRKIDHLKIEDRKVGILYQDDLLFPHLNVGENLLFAMKEPQDRKSRINIIDTNLEKAGLAGFFNRNPGTLSGGQRARVGALRTLLSNPKLILLDEPFSKLDKSLRSSFRDFVFTELKQQNIPCVIVTHDLDDIPAGSHKIQIE